MKRDYRYLFIFLCGISVVGNFYSQDSPALVKTQLIVRLEKEYSEYQSQIMPNMILPLMNGFLIDYYGDQMMTLIFMVFIVIGQSLFGYGIFQNNVQIMIFGKFLQGIGGESQFTALQILTQKWFSNKGLTFAYGCILSNYRLASICNAVITPYVSNHFGLNASLYLGIIVCLISLSATLGLVHMDITYKESICHKQTMKIKQIFLFWSQQNKLYKNLCIYTGIIYSSHITFVMYISGILVQDYLPQTNSVQKNQELAGLYMTIPFIIPAIVSPFFGMYIDKYGQRLNFLYLAPILMILGNILILNYCPLLCMIIFGCSLTIFSTIIWSTCTFLVSQKSLGMGFGVKVCVQSLFCAIIPIIIVPLKTYMDNNEKIILYQLMFLTCLSFYFLNNIRYYDSKEQVSINDPDQAKLLQQVINRDNIFQDQDEKKKLIYDNDCEKL